LMDAVLDRLKDKGPIDGLSPEEMGMDVEDGEDE